ncbi:MAG: hypothetical protein QOE62_2321 [Actinomycetota bacterium]|nr:hypothetical protein [Actinomycetota bacterium]
MTSDADTLERRLRSGLREMADTVDFDIGGELARLGAIEPTRGSPPRCASVVAAAASLVTLVLIAAVAFAVVSVEHGRAPRVVTTTPTTSATRGPAMTSIGHARIRVPAGWTSTRLPGGVLRLVGPAGAELHIVVRPRFDLDPRDTVATVAALGDHAAAIHSVEGGYALYADQQCGVGRCDRFEVYGYGLTLGEFRSVVANL